MNDLDTIRRMIRRRQGVAERAAQDAALQGHKYLVDYHMGGYSTLICLRDDIDRMAARRRKKSKRVQP